MGAACAPDIFQARMTSIFRELEYVQCYIDDLLIISSGDFDDHLEKLDAVLQKLCEKGFQVNAAKSNFCALELDYLGYTLSREGIAPQQKKVAAILALSSQATRKCEATSPHFGDSPILQGSVGEANRPTRTAHGSRGGVWHHQEEAERAPWRWEAEHDEAFSRIKEVIARDVILAFGLPRLHEKVCDLHRCKHSSAWGCHYSGQSSNCLFQQKADESAGEIYSY